MTGVVWLKGPPGEGAAQAAAGQAWGQAAAGEAQERVTEGREEPALEIPSARTSSLGHIPTATSLSPSVSPPPTSSSHFHVSGSPDTPDTSEGREPLGSLDTSPCPV